MEICQFFAKQDNESGLYKMKASQKLYFYTDNWDAFSVVFPASNIPPARYIYIIKGNNSNTRHQFGGFTRRTEVFSKFGLSISEYCRIFRLKTPHSFFQLWRAFYVDLQAVPGFFPCDTYIAQGRVYRSGSGAQIAGDWTYFKGAVTRGGGTHT